MTSEHSKIAGDGVGNNAGKLASPQWADGLKQLYDTVVDEPLPDAFKDLLARLDAKD